jgi:tRNA threonylcarbamoyladenosine modification (KEOPS) complex  Pcc1 subunit
MRKNYHATASFTLPLKNLTEAIYSALKPELMASDFLGSRVQISVEDHSMTVQIEAQNIATLRACINSYLRWIMAIRETLHAITHSS